MGCVGFFSFELQAGRIAAQRVEAPNSLKLILLNIEDYFSCVKVNVTAGKSYVELTTISIFRASPVVFSLIDTGRLKSPAPNIWLNIQKEYQSVTFLRDC